MTVNYFVVMTLLLLDQEGPEEQERTELLLGQLKNWVYARLLPGKDSFIGGPWMAKPLDYPSAQGHLASTYTGLCLLIQCGDYKFEGVDKLAVLRGLKNY